ncbi:MAG: hypothetical protein N3A63_10085 [Bacteroidetes bacterium]|nr:hypothetical protein [Bacteroidota bacterium]
MKLSQALRYVSGIILLAAVMFVGCVDVDNPNVSTVDLRTLTKFVYLNTQADVLRVTIDGSPVVQLAQGEETTFLNLPAGKRQMIFTYASGTKADTVSALSLPQDRKINFFCIYDPSAGVSSLQRQIIQIHTTYDGNIQYIPGKALVRFINFASVSAKLRLYRGIDSTITATIGFGGTTQYDTASVGPQFKVLSATNAVLVNVTSISGGEGRYSVVLYGNGTAYKVIKED